MALSILTIVLPWLLILLGLRFFYQLVRQNGRLLLHLEAIEDRLEQMADLLADSEEQPTLRNGRKPLSESRLKRDGLPAGTPAPDFRLPRPEGGELSLSEYRGKTVLLVFSDPHCGPCDALAPELEQTARQHPGVQVLMVSRGEVAENRKKVKQYRLTFPMVLQRKWEISKQYAMFATPIGYLIDEEGVTASEVAVGAEAILGLLSGATPEPDRKEAMSVS